MTASVIPSERRMTGAVIPSERSESRDLHVGSAFREPPTGTWYPIRPSYRVLQRQSPNEERRDLMIAASSRSRGARTIGGCHTRRHWNSPSYRTAAGNVSNCRRVTKRSLRQRIHVTNGAEGARTPDLCNANAALSQLSYSPASAMARGEQVSAPSITQTETA